MSPVLWHASWAWLSQGLQWQCFEKHLVLWEWFLLAITSRYHVLSCVCWQQGDRAGHVGGGFQVPQADSLRNVSALLAKGRHTVDGSGYLSTLSKSAEL